MKNFRFILLNFIASLFLASSLHASVEDRITFAITIKEFSEINKNRIKRLSITLAQKFKEKSGLEIDFSFALDENKVKKDFKEFEKYNSFIGYSTFFLENMDFFEEYGHDPFIFLDRGNDLSEYYLIANKKSGIKTIKDLKGKVLNSIITTSYYQIWLDYLSLKEFGKPYKKIIKKIIVEEKDNKKLLNVYFNKADFTVVSKAVYDDVILLNPSIINNLIIVKKSKPIFYYALGVFHKKTPKKLIDDFFDIVNSEGVHKELSTIYKLIGINGIEKRNFNDFDALKSFYNEYKKLKAVN